MTQITGAPAERKPFTARCTCGRQSGAPATKRSAPGRQKSFCISITTSAAVTRTSCPRRARSVSRSRRRTCEAGLQEGPNALNRLLALGQHLRHELEDVEQLFTGLESDVDPGGTGAIGQARAIIEEDLFRADLDQHGRQAGEVAEQRRRERVCCL